jgi:cytochrome c
MKRLIACITLASALSFAVLGPATTARAADDAAAWRALAVSHCSQCHTFEKGEPHGQGPNLWGLVGRPAGTAPGYRYSEGFLSALKGKIWDAVLLDRWFADTLAVAPDSQMIYFQDDAAKRAALIKFFESQR